MRTRGTPGPIQSFIVDDLVTFTAPDAGAAVVGVDLNKDAPPVGAYDDAGNLAAAPSPGPNRHQRRRADAPSRRRKTPGRRRS